MDLTSKVVTRHRKKYAVDTTSLAMLSEGQPGSRQVVLYDGVALEKLLQQGSDTFWDVWGENAGDFFVGLVEVRDEASCGDVYKVGTVVAKKGYGPLLYDIALSYAQKDGMDGLIPDRRSVSSAAAKVWKYYLERRGDVSSYPLGDSGNCRKYPEPFLNRVYAIQHPLNLSAMLSFHRKLAKLAKVANLYEDEYETHIREEGWGQWQDWARENY